MKVQYNKGMMHPIEISDGERIIDIDSVAREYAENHYSEWEETWYDYDGYNAEPENDKLELIDAFIAGAEWQKAKMMEEAVERVVKVDAGGYPYIDVTELYDYENDKPLAKAGDKVRVIVIKEEGEK